MKNLALILLLTLSGCQTGGLWTAGELKDWYVRRSEPEPRFLSPLYYRGTDERFHHFIYRTMDTWVPVKVRKEEIGMKDEKPHQRISSSTTFPGYYSVDPAKGFERIREQKTK
jgi:hypothetical protein